MNKVFIAGPFKASMNPQSGQIVESLKQRLVELTRFFEERGFLVYNAHRREGWGRDMMTPEECTAADFEQINDSDWLVALPGSPASPGTHIEIGWASALGKRIILLLQSGNEYAFLVRGLHMVADVHYVQFESDGDCMSQLSHLFPASS